MSAEFHSFKTADQLLATLADTIAGALSRAIASRGQASLVVCGGSTPGDLYDCLCHRALNWKDVAITLSDERWVPATSDRSNEKLVRSRLLIDEAAVARFVPLTSGARHAIDGLTEVEPRIAAMARPFDLTLLGMGEDGHTASLIPESAGLDDALDTARAALVGAITPPEATGMGERVTLTLRALLDSRRICILIRGDVKRLAYERAMADRDIREAPIRAVLAQSLVPTGVFWAP